MTLLLVVGILAILFFFYKRHVPVLQLKNIRNQEKLISRGDKVILDVRAYNTSCNGTFEIAQCIPLSYLKRNYQEIPNKPIILVASDAVEKNLAARFLKSRGFEVIGYYIANEEEPELFCYNF